MFEGAVWPEYVVNTHVRRTSFLVTYNGACSYKSDPLFNAWLDGHCKAFAIDMKLCAIDFCVPTPDVSRDAAAAKASLSTIHKVTREVV